MKRKFELLKKDEEDAKKQRAKRDGTYKSGGHMAGESGFDGIEQPKKKAQDKKDKICPHCGLHGHVLKRSKFCLMSPKNLTSITNTNTAPDELPSADPEAMPIGLDPADDIDAHDALPFDPADDIDAHDALPFGTELPGIDCKNDEFHDCGTWSDDEDGVLVVNAQL